MVSPQSACLKYSSADCGMHHSQADIVEETERKRTIKCLTMGKRSYLEEMRKRATDECEKARQPFVFHDESGYTLCTLSSCFHGYLIVYQNIFI